MISPVQMRMARAGLGWTLHQLAQRAKVNPNTLSRYEVGKDVMASTVRKLESVLMDIGVRFSEDDASITVRIPKMDSKKITKPADHQAS